MSNLVFVSGDFCSGSTLLFTLFRKTGQYYSLYEPLHELLLQYLFWPLEPDDHHFFVGNYHSEFKGFNKIPTLFNPRWGNSGLYLPAEEDADDLYRYLTYITGTAFGRSKNVMLKENRFTFRLGWLRAKFPHAKIVHIYRNTEAQWKSNLRRVRAWRGAEDVGQENAGYNGFNVATWCEDLKAQFPELDVANFQTGYQRFAKLWELSFIENQRYADISIDYDELVRNFEATCKQLWDCIGARGIDTARLKQFVVPSESQKPASIRASGAAQRVKRFIYRAGMKYARVRVRVALQSKA